MITQGGTTMEDAEREQLLARFEEIVSGQGDPAEAAACLTKAFPPWRVFPGDSGGWYAARAFTAAEMREKQAALEPGDGKFVGSGETIEAAGPWRMRDLLAGKSRP